MQHPGAGAYRRRSETMLTFEPVTPCYGTQPYVAAWDRFGFVVSERDGVWVASYCDINESYLYLDLTLLHLPRFALALGEFETRGQAEAAACDKCRELIQAKSSLFE